MNSLGIDIEGKVVCHDNGKRFLAESGFGCSPNTSGTKVFGIDLETGEHYYIRGYDVEGLAEDQSLPLHFQIKWEPLVVDDKLTGRLDVEQINADGSRSIWLVDYGQVTQDNIGEILREVIDDIISALPKT